MSMNQILMEVLEKSSKQIWERIATSAVIGATVDTTFALANKEKRNPKSLAMEFVCGAFSGAVSGAAGETHDHFRDKKDKFRTVVMAASSLSSRYAFRRITKISPQSESSPSKVVYDGDGEYYTDDDDDDDDDYGGNVAKLKSLRLPTIDK
jgi:hypothetical protein